MNVFYVVRRLLMVAVVFVVGCSSKMSHEEFVDEIRAYIKDNGYDATELESGLFYLITDEGSNDGKKPSAGSNVRVMYKGYLLDGTVFDSYEAPEGLMLNMASVIEGWQEGLQFFREGQSGKLFIPPKLGYGSNRAGSIPPNSILIFDITLVRVL
ncbi:MAG: FKBP-type peptidyl-prolyl cis-trans isomerase [Cryomorphaceae bacterium]|nr:FKBP-type peptidyl-prolyl cis-trans isomerase [Cryomorphaceae bacterium]